MMETTDRSAREQVIASTPVALAQRLASLRDQLAAVQVRELAALCRQMSQQYREAPEMCLERSWWQLFNQMGISLHEALDQAKAEDYAGLSNQEAEQAYFLLIHVAYFFTPGGIAETIWPILPVETAIEQVEISTNDALGVAFGRQPRVRQHSRLRQQVSRWKQQLGRLLGKSGSEGNGASVLRELVAYEPPSLDEDTAGLRPLAARRTPDGTHSGR